MSRVWDDNPHSTCIHPGGPLLQGAEQVLQSWGEIFSQARAPQVAYRLLQRLENDGLAIHTVEEAIRPGDGAAEPTLLIATNVYRHTDSGWRMVAHHACLPMLGQRQARGRSAHSVH
jgi:ketosteroid isomerase-like protein